MTSTFLRDVCERGCADGLIIDFSTRDFSVNDRSDEERQRKNHMLKGNQG